MGALIATIFTVITLAISSIFVSNELATRRSVSPNSPESKPAASSCKPCSDDEKGAGKDANGCYICVKTNGSSPTTNNSSTSNSSNSCAGPLSASLCKNKNVGDTECVGGVILKCLRTSGLNCSAYDTKVPCGNSPVTTSTLTPTPRPTASPTSYKTPSPTSSCACIGGYLVNCGAGSGAPCSVNIVPTATPKPTNTIATTTDTEEASSLNAERKECQLNGGAWTNNKCVYPTSTASLPKPSPTPKPTSLVNTQISVTPTPTKIISTTIAPSPTKICNVELLKTSSCGANGCLSNQVQQTWKDVNCQIKNICQDSESCNKDVCKVGQYQCDGIISVACINGKFNGVKQNCGSLGCNSITGKCNPTPTPIKTPTSTPLPDVHLGVSGIPSNTPTVTPSPTPYCKLIKKIICGSLGCEETLDGGTCKYNTSSALMVPVISISPSISPTVTTIPYDDNYFLARERLLCKRDGGVWKNNQCQDPIINIVTPTPTPTIIPLPDPKTLDNYKNSGDSQTFANTTDEIAGVIYSCQKKGNISGIALRNCLCDSIDCNTKAGQVISDSIFTYSSDGNGLQCVEFVSALETLQKNSSTSNCSNNGAQTGDEMADCAEPGYLRCDRGNGASFIEGDIVVWDGEPGHSEGHVAICVEVKNNGEDCVVAESNWNNDQTVGFRTIHSDGSDSYNHHSILRRTSVDNQSCY